MTGPVTVAGAGVESGPELERAAGLIRDVPDYPSPGILFRDITPLLADAEAFTVVTTELASLVGDADLVAGVEARGFLLGAAVAVVAGTGVVPVRKAGKLPRVAGSRTYDLEYGTATLELPADTLAPGRGCSSSTTCSPPAAPQRPRPTCWPRWAPPSSDSARCWSSPL